MSHSNLTNRRIVLASRPNGAPTSDNFRLEESPIPTPNDGQILLRTLHLSLDPYMRGRMSDKPSYAPPIQINALMVGATVSSVIVSKHPDFNIGDLVLSFGGWQEYSIADSNERLIKLSTQMKASHALGVLGMPGLTAYAGLLEIGQPKAGDTVVVAAATGAVGSLVGQIAKIKDARVIGIAGGAEKCQYAVDTLGFDACIDHRRNDFADALKTACHTGIDVYFENVGGAVFDAVLPLLNPCARIPVCGLISAYNATELPKGPDRLSLLAATLLTRRIKMQGFIVFDDFGHHYETFFKEMSLWLNEEKITFREDFITGLDNAPEAFIGLLQGANFGKLIINI